MDIGNLGKVLVEQLVDARLVLDLADLFALHRHRSALLALDRMAEKSADNVLARSMQQDLDALSQTY